MKEDIGQGRLTEVMSFEYRHLRGEGDTGKPLGEKRSCTHALSGERGACCRHAPSTFKEQRGGQSGWSTGTEQKRNSQRLFTRARWECDEDRVTRPYA